MVDLSQLELNLGITFQNKDLLLQSLTHRSYINENSKFHLDHNERLEFLGDAVLELAVTEHLYKNYPNPEGDLTSWRAALVNAKILSTIASNIGLNDFLLLSRGEAKDTGKARQIILANAIEAVIGAIYLDQGYGVAENFIEGNIIAELSAIIKGKSYKDSKSYFQEKAQEAEGVTPTYEVLEEWGPDHAKQFRIGVFLNSAMAGVGEGESKQDAQQAAAEDALKKMGWE